jgi:formylglycine-generating enzyme required for sulfatase activity
VVKFLVMGRAKKIIFISVAVVALAALSAGAYLLLAYRPVEFTDRNGTWVLVPEGGTFGLKSFYAMKYEAKCFSLKGEGLTGGQSGAYDASESPCVRRSGKRIRSDFAGSPIGYVSHDEAKEYCEDIGARLMSNEEFMGIVRGAETVRDNWSGGAEGEGTLYFGNSGVYPSALSGESVPEDEADASAVPQAARRWLALSNGARIYDLAGNLWEHVMRSSEDLKNFVDLPSCSDGAEEWGYCVFGGSADEGVSAAIPYVSAWTEDVTLLYVGPSHPSLLTGEGAGSVYTFKSGGKKSRAGTFLRGGSFSVPEGGAYSLSLKPESSNPADYADVGFRCVKDSRFSLPF